MKTLQEREQDFITLLTPFVQEYTRETVRAFFDYWSEPDLKGKKMRFENQKFFEVKRRLATWKRNEMKFCSPKQLSVEKFKTHFDIVNEAEANLKRKYENE